MADLSTDALASSTIRVAGEAASALGLEQASALDRLRGLIDDHRSDWVSFLDHLGPSSWVTRLGRPLE